VHEAGVHAEAEIHAGQQRPGLAERDVRRKVVDVGGHPRTDRLPHGVVHRCIGVGPTQDHLAAPLGDQAA
jgi:hypothetical protein